MFAQRSRTAEQRNSGPAEQRNSGGNSIPQTFLRWTLPCVPRPTRVHGAMSADRIGTQSRRVAESRRQTSRLQLPSETCPLSPRPSASLRLCVSPLGGSSAKAMHILSGPRGDSSSQGAGRCRGGHRAAVGRTPSPARSVRGQGGAVTSERRNASAAPPAALPGHDSGSVSRPEKRSRRQVPSIAPHAFERPRLGLAGAGWGLSGLGRIFAPCDPACQERPRVA